MTALLDVQGLSCGYGPVPVLHGIDLALEPATITVVLGANGAGKTTLLRSLSGLLTPTAGTVRFGGRDLVKVPVELLVTLGVAHVPEGRGVIAELTVEDNLRLGGLWRRGPRAARETTSAIEEVYELFEPLAQRRRYHGHQLSGGERQMLALGRALVARPSLLMLDEPSLGLAPVITARIMALLRSLRDTAELTVLLVEQNVRSALAIADEAVVLALGRVVARGRAAELQSDAKLRHAYLGF
ncbi:MAG TPA: ABC transporter ATP-binding protein [Jatrophihabitans sp.]|nr:ABC transporter ATP-binding protein [Jatrophihabitans sp.]